MKLIELQKYGDYSVIMRQGEKGNLIKINPFVVAWGATKDDDGEVVDWGNGHYFDDLFTAVDFARQRGCNVPSYYRLEEIATETITALTEHDDIWGWQVVTDRVDLNEHESEYFGIDEEEFEKWK